MTERVFDFECCGDNLCGIVHKTEITDNIGLLIIVGGPQYRVGSHRQFVLLARMLATHGVCTMRFDYRGMGDSEGQRKNYEEIEEDIKIAIDKFFAEASDISDIILWGLCDAATAAVNYAHKDPRVKGLVLLNPWVRDENTLAKTFIKHYYLKRIQSSEFWKKLLKGDVHIYNSLSSLVRKMISALKQIKQDKRHMVNDPAQKINTCTNLQKKLIDSIDRFKGSILFILSGNDLTAAEFKESMKNNKQWNKLIKRETITIKNIDEANHTFAKQEWRDQVAKWTLQWVKSL